jgi:hypothetical protein
MAHRTNAHKAGLNLWKSGSNSSERALKRPGRIINEQDGSPPAKKVLLGKMSAAGQTKVTETAKRHSAAGSSRKSGVGIKLKMLDDHEGDNCSADPSKSNVTSVNQTNSKIHLLLLRGKKMQTGKTTVKEGEAARAGSAVTKIRRSGRQVKKAKFGVETQEANSDTEKYLSENDVDGDDDDREDEDYAEEIDDDSEWEEKEENAATSKRGRPKKTTESYSSGKEKSFRNIRKEDNSTVVINGDCVVRQPVAFKTFAKFYRNDVNVLLPTCGVCHHPFVDESSRDAHVKHYGGQKIETCSVCQRDFHNLDVLNAHILFDHEEKLVVKACYACENVRETKHDLVKHFVESHLISKGLTTNQLHLDCLTVEECEMCHQKIPSDPQLIALHQKAHRRASRPSRPVSATTKAFVKAKRTKQGGGPSGTQCCTCQRVFKNKYLAFFHAWFEHNDDTLPFQGAAMLDQDARNKIRQMVEDEQESRALKTDEAATTSSKMTNQDGKGRDGKVSFWCAVCGSMLHDQRIKIIKHLGLHHNRLFANSMFYLNKKHGVEENDHRVRMTYQCPECKDEIQDIRNRVGFHRLTHGHVDDTNRHLRCRFCPAFFFCVSRVKLHEKTKHATHADEFTGVCDTCGSSFSSQRAMDKHMKLHNQTLINCDLCNRGFKTQEAMEKHRSKHDQDQYCCPHCGEQYMGKNSLNKHIKVGTGTPLLATITKLMKQHEREREEKGTRFSDRRRTREQEKHPISMMYPGVWIRILRHLPNWRVDQYFYSPRKPRQTGE